MNFFIVPLMRKAAPHGRGNRDVGALDRGPQDGIEIIVVVAVLFRKIHFGAAARVRKDAERSITITNGTEMR